MTPKAQKLSRQLETLFKKFGDALISGSSDLDKIVHRTDVIHERWLREL